MNMRNYIKSVGGLLLFAELTEPVITIEIAYIFCMYVYVLYVFVYVPRVYLKPHHKIAGKIYTQVYDYIRISSLAPFHIISFTTTITPSSFISFFHFFLFFIRVFL